MEISFACRQETATAAWKWKPMGANERMGSSMLTRRFLGTAVAALAFVAASGTARAAERQLMGIVLGRRIARC